MRKRFFRLLLMIGIAFITLGLTACNKKSNSGVSLPSAKSLIDQSFKQGLANGHYVQKVNSDEMKQNSKAEGYFKGTSLLNMNYSLTSKGKTQGEQIWLDSSTLYLLLEQNKGKWIKNKSTADNFDPDQVTHRFNPDTFSDLNKVMAKNALVKQNSSTYTVSFSGQDQTSWKAISGLIVDSLNTPGSQNMQVAQMVNAAQPQSIQVTYTFNKNNKKLTKISLKSTFAVGAKYNFTWSLTYDELGQHADLAIPTDIQKNAIDVEKIKAAQGK